MTRHGFDPALDEKTCKCGATFRRSPHHSRQRFAAAKFCGQRCSARYASGGTRPTGAAPSVMGKEQHEPWVTHVSADGRSAMRPAGWPPVDEWLRGARPRSED